MSTKQTEQYPGMTPEQIAAQERYRAAHPDVEMSAEQRAQEEQARARLADAARARMTSDEGPVARPAPAESPLTHDVTARPQASGRPLDMISHGEAIATARDTRRASARVEEQRAILAPLIKAVKKRRATVAATWKLQRDSLERISRVDWTRLVPAWGPDAARGMGPLVIEAERLLTTMRTWLNGCDRLLQEAEPMLTRAVDEQTLAELRTPLERMGAQPGMDYDEECAIFARRLNWLIDMATAYHMAHRGEEAEPVTTVRPLAQPEPKKQTHAE